MKKEIKSRLQQTWNRNRDRESSLIDKNSTQIKNAFVAQQTSERIPLNWTFLRTVTKKCNFIFEAEIPFVCC